MVKKLQQFMSSMSTILELILALSIAIFLIVLYISITIGNVEALKSGYLQMSTVLSQAMSLAIAIEFIKMLCLRTPAAILEVLVFAISRQLIVEHGSAATMICGVVSIAILFAVRRYLFYPGTKHNPIE